MRLLVIGGTEFFGKRIVEQSLARGDEVTVFTRGRRRPAFWDAIEHIRGDWPTVARLRRPRPGNRAGAAPR